MTTAPRQMTLGDILPPSNGTPTSVAAAKSMVEPARLQRSNVLVFLLSCGERGATRQEIEDGVHLSGNSVRPRVRELVKLGRIYETQRLRHTKSGRSAAILRAVLYDE